MAECTEVASGTDYNLLGLY